MSEQDPSRTGRHSEMEPDLPRQGESSNFGSRSSLRIKEEGRETFSGAVDSAVANAQTEPPPASLAPTQFLTTGEPFAGGPAHQASASEAPVSQELPKRISDVAVGHESDALIGQLIDGRYLVESVVGQGAMGLVYRCRHAKLEKQVAMKVLKRELASDPEATDRFVREAKAASAIGNTHIVGTLDFGTMPDGSTYMVMEYLEGQTLAALLTQSPLLPFDTILSIARQVAEGLSAAHRAGVVHRDLKPDNLFLTAQESGEPFVKLLDFGIAKVASAQSKLTRAGSVFGTPHYMSPEQAAAHPTDHRCDVYSLGVILYELCVGAVPFDAENPMSVLAAHIHQLAPPLTPRLPPDRTLPPGLEVVILKCLRKVPDERYQTMDEVLSELERVAQGVLPLSSVLPSEWENESAFPLSARKPEASSAKRILRGLGLVAAVAAPAVGFAYWRSRASDTPPMPVPSPSVRTVVERVFVPAPSEPSAKPVGTRVDFVLFPLDAHLYLGHEDLGPMPVSVTVPPNEKLTVFIRRPGYWARRIVVDGSKSRIVVGLRKLTLPKPAEGEAIEEDKAAAKAASKSASDKKKAGEASAEAKPGETKSGETKPAPGDATKVEKTSDDKAHKPKQEPAPPTKEPSGAGSKPAASSTPASADTKVPPADKPTAPPKSASGAEK